MLDCRISSMAATALRTASSNCFATAVCTAFSAACCSLPWSALMSPSGVMMMRCVLGASANTGAGGFDATGEGEGKVATSASLCSSVDGDSSVSAGSVDIAGAGTSGSAAENCGSEVVVSPKPNQSCGGAEMPQTFAGTSSSTPTCCSSRVLCDA